MGSWRHSKGPACLPTRSPDRECWKRAPRDFRHMHSMPKLRAKICPLAQALARRTPYTLEQ
jgi:hypothetical protein